MADCATLFNKSKKHNNSYVLPTKRKLKMDIEKAKSKLKVLLTMKRKNAYDAFCELCEKYNLFEKLTGNEVYHIGYLFTKPLYQDIFRQEGTYINLGEVAELILLLKNGKNITLSAYIPKGTPKEVEIGEAINDIIQQSLQTYLANTIGKDTLELIRTAKGYPTDLKELSDKELEELKNEGTQQNKVDALMQGRMEKHIPLIGGLISDILEYEGFSKLSKGESYCFIGDMFHSIGVFSDEDWNIRNGREKKEIVKGWIKSYQNTQGKITDIQGGK